MLPKPEKKSKKKVATEQLDLVETISEGDKSRKKRQSTILFLFLTVGISLIFFTYRQAKNFNFQAPSLPHLNFKMSKSSQSFTPSFPLSWSVSVSTIGSTFYSFNSPPALKPDFSQVKTPVTESIAKKQLPEGVKVVEKFNLKDDRSEILSDISTPKVSFRLYAQIPGDINRQGVDREAYSQLAKDLYWYLIKRVESE